MSGNLSTWINELIPAGSDDYYRLLGLNQKKKQALQSLLCFFNNIDKVLLSTNDDAVCQQKLGWWQQEIASTYQGKASHPLTKALAPIIKEYNLAMNSFNEYIESTQSLITNCRFDTFQDYLVFTMHCAGLREWLIAQVLSPNTTNRPLEKLAPVRKIAGGSQHRTGVYTRTHEDLSGEQTHKIPTSVELGKRSNDQQHIFQLALCIDLIDQLKQCRSKLRKGYVFFDNATLATFTITRRDLLTLKTPTEFSKLAYDHCQKARAAFEGTFTKLSKQQKKQLRPIIVRCILGLKWCDSIKEEDYQIMQKHISLTPVRKWLFALFSRKN
jgi:15-cis-phytoene synthase